MVSFRRSHRQRFNRRLRRVISSLDLFVQMNSIVARRSFGGVLSPASSGLKPFISARPQAELSFVGYRRLALRNVVVLEFGTGIMEEET